VRWEGWSWIVLRHLSEFLSGELEDMVAYRCLLAAAASVENGYL
jgi:hypothetical protein